MKKSQITLAVLATILLAGGVYYLRIKSRVVSKTNDKVGGSIFTSIKDALSKDITLACEFKDDRGVSVKSYIKNGSVRIMSTSVETNSDQTSDIILKDKKMYMWGAKTKQGFMYEISDTNSDNPSDIAKGQNYLDMIDKYKDSCKVATVEDSYFVIPSDVKFQDMNKMLEDLKKQMPQVELPKQ
jgi:hypothetical protein